MSPCSSSTKRPLPVATNAWIFTTGVPAISGGLLVVVVGGRGAEHVWAQQMTGYAGGCFDGQNVLCWHATFAVDPSPHVALPDGLFFSGKESGQSALASDRCDCGFER